MRTIARSFLVLLLFAICSFKLYAQQKAAAPAKLFFEKVYLHTDRDEYAQGDTIWYKAYLVNGQTNTPIYTSRNLYTELVSKDSSKTISHQVVHLTGSTGNAEFALEDSIPAGKYMIRAYTNWMRNFGDNFVFEKDITIINTLIPTPGAASKSVPAVASKKSGGSIQSSPTSNGLTIHFYPEGGSLVEGVNSLVAVKAENTWGKGIPIKGAVLSASGDTAATFNCDTLGMGLFVLLPVKGQTYHAGLVNDKKASFDVPRPLLKGFAMRVSHRDSLITVIISCNDEALADNTGKSFTLSGRHGGKTDFRQAIAISGVQTLVRMSDNVFPDGVAVLTLAEENQPKPHCERLVYIHHANADASLVVKTDKATYQPKEKVSVGIKTNGGKTNLSVACVDASIVPGQADNIVSNLMLQSELRGKVESAGRYFDTTNVNRAKQMDLLLMTQGWRDFVWRRMQDTAIRLSYNLENSVTVSGKVLSGTSTKPLDHINITMFANNNKGVKLFSGVTDSLGRFIFTGLEQYGDHIVKLSASDSKGNKKGMFVMDTLVTFPVRAFPKAAMLNGQADTSTAALVSAAIKRREAVLAQKMKMNKNLKEVKITASRAVVLGSGNPMMTFGKDQSFDITAKDYQYKTLEWWMLHNVKGAMQSNDGSVTGVVVYGMDTLGAPTPPNGRIAYREASRPISPEFFVNGRELYPLDETEAESYRQIYYPLTIDKFKHITFKHVVGSLINSDNAQAQRIMVDRYLLYITLKDGVMVGYNPGVLNPEVSGYYEAQTFYQPNYSTPRTNTDLRTTIHWQPNITTDANGGASVSFYNADPKGKMRIIVEGLTDKGVPIATTVSYIVK